ncbi:MAG: ankyrin repeat domain-containing protein, partial [Pseudomonadota bacterium]
MLMRIVIVPLLVATLCTIIALPVGAQVVEGFRLDRQGQRLSDAAKTEEDRNKAEEKFKAALSIFRNFNHPKGEAQVLNDFGILSAKRGKYSEAIEYYNQALEIKRRIGWPWGEGNSLVNLGSLYGEQGDLSKAAEYYEQALKAYERARHDKAVGSALDLLGKTYDKLGQHPKAEECMRKALDLARKTKSPADEAHALGDLGAILVAQDKYSEAGKYLEESANLAKKAGKTDLERWALQYLAWTREHLGQDSGAIEAYEKALEMARTQKDGKAQLQIASCLPHLYFTKQNYAKAAQLCTNAVESASKLEDRLVESRIRNTLEEICRVWEKTDPGNEDLKRAKYALIKGTAKDPLNKELFAAIESTDVEKVKSLLAKGANANVFDEEVYRTPLVLAARNGPVEMVKLLLANGADLKMKYRHGLPVPAYAFTEAMVHGREDIARLFLELGADVNTSGMVERSPLECAVHCSPEFVKVLLDKGARVNGKSKNGYAALVTAARLGKADTVRLLLDRGVDASTRTKHGVTPLTAVPMGEGFRKSSGKKPAGDSYLRVVELLLHKGADADEANWHGRTLLMAAAGEGHPEIAGLMLEKGADVNAKDKNGRPPLMYATEAGDTKIIGLLIAKGADVNAKNQYGETALKNAVDSGHVEAVKLLLENGADPNVKLDDGTTVLMIATIPGHTDVVKLLLEKGAEVNAQ